jgi:hypothetical protein
MIFHPCDSTPVPALKEILGHESIREKIVTLRRAMEATGSVKLHARHIPGIESYLKIKLSHSLRYSTP